MTEVFGLHNTIRRTVVEGIVPKILTVIKLVTGPLEVGIRSEGLSMTYKINPRSNIKRSKRSLLSSVLLVVLDGTLEVLLVPLPTFPVEEGLLLLRKIFKGLVKNLTVPILPR